MTTAEWVDPLSLPPGSVLEIETRSRRYQVECLGGRRIRISGHPEFWPTPSPATLQGSIDKAGVSEPLISPVLKVRVQRAPAVPSSVHQPPAGGTMP